MVTQAQIPAIQCSPSQLELMESLQQQRILNMLLTERQQQQQLRAPSQYALQDMNPAPLRDIQDQRARFYSGVHQAILPPIATSDVSQFRGGPFMGPTVPNHGLFQLTHHSMNQFEFPTPGQLSEQRRQRNEYLGVKDALGCVKKSGIHARTASACQGRNMISAAPTSLPSSFGSTMEYFPPGTSLPLESPLFPTTTTAAATLSLHPNLAALSKRELPNLPIPQSKAPKPTTEPMEGNGFAKNFDGGESNASKSEGKTSHSTNSTGTSSDKRSGDEDQV